jgi:murein DD-endopeptidase MepM/ murein hydrolase activator NlpD
VIRFVLCCNLLFCNKKETGLGFRVLFINFINSAFGFMSITVIYSSKGTDHLFSFTKKKFLFILLFLISFLVVCVWSIQVYNQNLLNQFKETISEHSETEKANYKALVKAQNEEKLFVLANKLGDLQAQMNRINALSQRVIEKTRLPAKEFDLQAVLPAGGPSIDTDTTDIQINDLVSQIKYIDENIKNREKQLHRVEITLNNHHLSEQLYISGRPVKGKGSWLSSPFGIRKDPFTGRLAMHKGIDVAGSSGMPIIATAAGVVTASGKRSGYGLMVEIEHGHGLVTRYAHAQSLNVSVGEIVRKGQQIAVMGSTGRSTGPHVHYEVLKNGKQINPNYYIQRKAA